MTVKGTEWKEDGDRKNVNICFYCMNAFIDDSDKLHCMADGHDHEATVGDDDSCDDFN